MKRNIYIGIVFYMLYLFLGASSFDLVEAVLLLSVLVFVPIAYWLIYTTKRDGSPLLFHRSIVQCFPMAAGSAVITFLFDIAWLALVWWLYGILLALFAIVKCLERGCRPLHELAIDSGFMYLSIGGFWVYASVAQLEIMNFSQEIVLLTAVHFHYSSFIIPIVAGLLGRLYVRNRSIFNTMLIIIIVSPLTVAVGITYSRVIEWLAVCLYFISLYMYGYFVLTTAFRNRLAKGFVVVSALILLVTISFSLIYAYGRLQHSFTISIETMVWIHGVTNAFGVVLGALIGWSLEKTEVPYAYYGKKSSNIYGNMKIGSSFLSKKQLLSNEAYSGLVDSMKDYQSSHFDANQLSTIIRNFYEQTENYSMRAQVQWSPWFRPFAALYSLISKKTEQIHLGLHSEWQQITGEIVGVTSEKDGRKQVRAWIRTNEKDETMFVALYSMHTYDGEVYMNIALPLLFSNMTGILRLENQSNQLVITSKVANDRKDEGIYLCFSKLRIMLPLSETFYIEETDEGELTADHQMKIFGKRFLRIRYRLMKREVREECS